MRLPAFGACVALTSLLAAPLAFADADAPQTFITKAIQGDNSELELGRLAATKAESQGVRDYGNMLAADHEKAKEQALRIARGLGITPPREPMEKAKAERDKLERLSGRKFDEEFLRYMIDDHRDDIKDFREQADAGHHEVSRMAKDQLPTLQKHLDTAEHLMQSRNERRRG
jgi:putative membrane protein